MEPVDISDIQRDSTAQAMDKLAGSKQHIKATQEALDGLSGALKASTAAASLLGIESDKLAQAEARVKTATEMVAGVSKAASILDKESYFNVVFVAKAKDLLTAANSRLAVALGISTAAARVLMGTLTLGVSVAITVAIEAWNKYAESQEKAAAKAREQMELERQGRARMVETRVELDQVISSLKNFNGTKDQEKAKINDLNSKYGETFGYYNSIAQWYDVLSQKGEAYIKTLFLQAKAQNLISKAVEADAKANEIAATPASNYREWGMNGERNKAKALTDAQNQRDALLKDAGNTMNQAVQVSKEAGIGDYAPQKQQQSQAGDGQKAQEDALSKQAKTEQKKRELAAKIAELKQQTRELLVESWEEGPEKKKEMAATNLDEEMARITQQWTDIQQVNAELQASGGETDPKLLQQGNDEVTKQYNMAAAKYAKELEAINKEAAANEKQAQQQKKQAQLDYLKEFGAYQEKRLAIIQDYENQIAAAKTPEQEEALNQKKNTAVEALDKSMLQQTDLWKRLFEDADKHTSNYIKNTIKQAKQLLDYLEKTKNNDGTEEKPKLPEGISPEQASSLKPEDVKNVLDSLQKQGETLSKKNPFMGLINGFKDLKDAGSDSEKQLGAMQNIFSGFKGASAIIGEVGGAISKMGGSAGESMQKISGVIDSTVSMATTGLSVGGAWGAAIGGALGLASGLVGALGADYSGYDAMVDKYDSLMDVWDQLLDKKKAYIKESYGAEATKAGAEALKLIDSEKEVTKQLGAARLSAGSSAGSHSQGYRMWKGSAKYEGQNWQNVNKDVVSGLKNANLGDDVQFGGMSDMLNMTAEQLEWIKVNYSGLWSVMDGDFRGYLDKIIEYGDAKKEIIASVKEQITGVSLDSFEDSYLSLLDNMDSTNQDFADSMEKYLRKSILQSLLSQNYSGKIKSLYDSWALYGEDGEITEKEANDLRKMQQEMSESMLAERDRLAETFGWTSDTAGKDTQSGRSGAITTVTEETAGKLEGIGLSIQTHVISMDEKMGDLTRYSYEAIGLLGSIAENTGYCRCLKEISDTMNRMERDGMKIKG